MVHGLFDVKQARSLEAKNKGLRARLEPWREGRGWSPRRAKHPFQEREGGLEDVWREDMDVENETESHTKMDEQKKNLQKELRDVDKLLCLPKRNKGEPQECPAAATARGGAKEARPHA